MRYDIENSSDKINSLFNMFIQKKYGDLIYHSEIEAILGFDREVTKYGIYVRHAKDRLIQYSKVLKAIPGVGFQVLKPQQVSGYVYRKYIKRTLNLYNYSTDILGYLNKDGFSDVRMKEFNEVKELNDALREKTKSMIQESGYYSRKDYYDSLDIDD